MSNEYSRLYLYLKITKTFVQVEINKVSHGLGIEDRHQVARLGNAWASEIRFERVGSQNFNGKWSNWLPVEIFFSHHRVDTQMQLWVQKSQHRNPSKKFSSRKCDERG